MKRISFALPIIVLILVAAGCSKDYFIHPNFEQKTFDHQTVAVLPFKMIFTGKQPEDITEEQIAELEEAESQAFQMSLYDELLMQSGVRKRDIKIEFQPVEKTNASLEAAGISIRDSWTMAPDELAQVLGVDAVVVSNVYKKRYMSDLASFGIDLGVSIMNMVTDGLFGAFTPYNANKTNDIKSDCSLINATDASVLWKMDFIAEVDWRNNTQQIIQTITYRYARKFPYRKREVYY